MLCSDFVKLTLAGVFLPEVADESCRYITWFCHGLHGSADVIRFLVVDCSRRLSPEGWWKFGSAKEKTRWIWFSLVRNNVGYIFWVWSVFWWVQCSWATILGQILQKLWLFDYWTRKGHLLNSIGFFNWLGSSTCLCLLPYFWVYLLPYFLLDL